MMKFNQPRADVYVSGEQALEAMLPRTTHLAIVAHQDDIEILALHGILACFQSADKVFGGVVVTDGGGSPRTGPYADCSDEEMCEIRVKEQRKAAEVGEYVYAIQLGYPSAAIKSHDDGAVEELCEILRASQPEVLYLHNPFDKHDTHVAVLGCCLEAVRRLAPEQRPKCVFGVEVWRDLDWLVGDRKVALAVGQHPNLSAALLGVFDSQISGGKRYDLSAEARQLANATFYDAFTVDGAKRLTYAIDMTPLFQGEISSVQAFVKEVLSEFSADVVNRVTSYMKD